MCVCTCLSVCVISVNSQDKPRHTRHHLQVLEAAAGVPKRCVPFSTGHVLSGRAGRGPSTWPPRSPRNTCGYRAPTMWLVGQTVEQNAVQRLAIPGAPNPSAHCIWAPESPRKMQGVKLYSQRDRDRARSATTVSLGPSGMAGQQGLQAPFCVTVGGPLSPGV